MKTTEYGFEIHLPASLAEARKTAEDALKEQGFGILTEIDVAATLKKKLDVDFKPYVILGACNPPLAHRALQAEEQIGLLLPCNVIVYETEPGVSRVVAIDPLKAMAIVDNAQLGQIATEAQEKLIAALTAIEENVTVKEGD
ncbi:MAG: DUF302 domain-containing protein [Candidatus Zixiibacteriota bacterium]|nr:MAG: DUF302 domain-containing protein [candidate division Zixibacteria bacterium]